jgi:hypothetical protein
MRQLLYLSNTRPDFAPGEPLAGFDDVVLRLDAPDAAGERALRLLRLLADGIRD